jgi:uncharacterized protein YaiI (UPF0178 family)
MKILVDADSCPRDARELTLRCSRRRGIQVVFAANRPIPGLFGENIVMEICPPGENAADDRLVELAVSGDIAVSRDLALAKRLLEKDAVVIDDRGRLFTLDNINELLSLRNFTVALAENGLGTERTASYGKKELKAFADSLDRQLTKNRVQRTKNKEFFLPAAVIFDMDGLMFDTENLTIPLWEIAGKPFGYNLTHDIVIRMVGISGEKARQVLLEEIGSDFP